MRVPILLALLASTALVAQAPAPKASAEVKVGTGIEKMEIQGEASDFKVAAGTKIHVWARVSGVENGTVTSVFSMGERTSKQELKVPYSPYRTHAYRTFRQGDTGTWTVKILGADGTELGSSTFTVEIQ